MPKFVSGFAGSANQDFTGKCWEGYGSYIAATFFHIIWFVQRSGKFTDGSIW